MFWRQRTRIALCRAGFLLGCALPTLLVGVWTFWLQSGFYREQAQRDFALETGLALRVGGISHPTLGSSRWQDAALYDPANGTLVAKAKQIDIEPSPRGWHATFHGAWVDESIGAATRESIGRRLARGDENGKGVWLRAASVRWHCGDTEVSLTDVSAGMEFSDSASQVFLTFKKTDLFAQPGQKQGPWARLVRRNQQGSPRYEVELQTAGSGLPCRWFAALGADLARFGEQAKFAGKLRGVRPGAEWTFEAEGRFFDLDLASLVGSDTSHRLTGSAEFFTHAGNPVRIVGGRVERLSGAISAGPGDMSASLVDSLSRHLQLKPAEEKRAANAAGNIPYLQLACDVRLDARGIALQGRCDQPGAILMDEQGPIALAPERAAAIGELVAALAPPSEIAMPATCEAQRLASRLPSAPVATPPRIGARARLSAPQTQ